MNAQYTTLKYFISPEKEEAWLGQMARQGWFLHKVSAFYNYTFHQGAPEPRDYKIDYRSFRSAPDREDYLAMFSDSGWQPVMAKEANGAFYFYAPVGSARREIFSDDVSRAGRNLRFAKLSAWSIIPAFLPLLVLYLTGKFALADAGYLTPGLWEMQGLEFVFHFLFETPFVVMRSTAYFLPLLPLALALVFLVRYWLQYRRVAKQQMI